MPGQLTAAVYRWIDENGKTHFSDKPHENAKQITIKKPNTTNLVGGTEQLRRQQELLQSFENERAEKKRDLLKQKQQQQKVDNYCRRQRNRLLNYKEADRLFLRDDDGTKKILNSARKRREIEKLEKEIKDRCS